MARERDAERAEIARVAKKKDGTSASVQTVDSILQRLKEAPRENGREDRTAGGRPRDVAAKQLESMRQILLTDVGKRFFKRYVCEEDLARATPCARQDHPTTPCPQRAQTVPIQCPYGAHTLAIVKKRTQCPNFLYI